MTRAGVFTNSARGAKMYNMNDRNGLSLEQFLAAYDASKYPHPSLTVDIALFTLLERENALKLGVLLIRRGGHPYIGMPALPGGFVDMDEELHTAAARELMEETGVEGVTLRQFGTYGLVGRDPRTRVVTVGFFGMLPFGSPIPKAGDDAAEAEFYTVRITGRGGDAPGYDIWLGNSADVLACRILTATDDMGAHVVERVGHTLAGDHECVLTGALQALNSMPRPKAATLLTRNNPEYQRACRSCLDEALMGLAY